MRISKLFSSVRILQKAANYTGICVRNCSTGIPPDCPNDEEKIECNKKGLVLCVYEKNNKFELPPEAEEINEKSGGKIAQKLNEINCGELTLGKAVTFTEVHPDYAAVAVASIGPKDAGYNSLEIIDEARENIRWGVGAGVRALSRAGCGAGTVAAPAALDAAGEAAQLAAWRFQKFKSPSARRPEFSVSLFGNTGQEQWEEGVIRGEAQNWARYLSDMPANMMQPIDLAQAALDRLCPLGIQVQAHDRAWLESQRMRAFLAVASGSCDTPVLVHCSYTGAAQNSPPVLIAAKGVTFDSGGLCLKECHSMTENRGSMAGAAVVFAALEILAKLKVPINVCAVVPVCENMVSGQCMKVGDVVKALNGLSIQIENTDMEGRLMMADALVYGQALHKPSLVIDVATFTQGVLMATGGGAFGAFSNSDSAWKALQHAGAVSGDRPWRFPLWQYYQNQITNDPSVDLRNKGAGHATPCLGAAFLKNFICGDWVHMDITGVGKVAHIGAPPYLHPRRMTGRPARTLATLLQNISAASAEKHDKCEKKAAAT